MDRPTEHTPIPDAPLGPLHTDADYAQARRRLVEEAARVVAWEARIAQMTPDEYEEYLQEGTLGFDA